MLFKYQALHREGSRITGHMWAQHEQDVLDRLRLLHIQPFRVYRVMWVKRRLKPTELIDFLLYLSWMLRAGVPLQEALQELTLSSQTGKQCQVALQLIAYMEPGLLLSDAMACLPAVFSPLAVYYTVVGEKSGELVHQLTLLLSALQWQAEWQDKIFRVLAYPLFTFCVAMAAVGYLLLAVIPTLVVLLPTTESPVPIIVACHIWLQTHGIQAIVLLSIALVSIYGCVWYFPRCRYSWDKWILYVPAVGWLIRDSSLTRVVEVIAHLHGAGFTLLDCLYVGQDLVRNQALQAQIAQVAQAMEAGATLTHSFTQSGIFPPILLRALHLAEKSGHVAVALTHAAQFFRSQVTLRMRLLEALLGPVCLLLVGGILIGVVLTVFAPIFGLIGQVY